MLDHKSLAQSQRQPSCLSILYQFLRCWTLQGCMGELTASTCAHNHVQSDSFTMTNSIFEPNEFTDLFKPGRT